jgi:hypothetical protein
LAANTVKKAKSSRRPAGDEVNSATAATAGDATVTPKKPLVRPAGSEPASAAIPREELVAATKKAAKKGPKLKAPPPELADEEGEDGEAEDALLPGHYIGIDMPAVPTAQWLEGSEAATNEEKRRKAVVPSQTAQAGVSLFEYLRTCTPPLDQKIIDISIAQTQVPLELRLDAAQEIRVVWSQMTPDLGRFRPGQIASYAHRMAKHTALRVRRELGSSVRLPGSAFRKRRDGSSYVTPGVLSVALDWNELEGWLDMDNASSEDSFVMNMGLGIGEEDALAELGGMVEAAYTPEESEEETLKSRHAIIESFKDQLTDRQYQILIRLTKGDTYEEIQAALGIKKGVMMRELNNSACIIGPL